MQCVFNVFLALLVSLSGVFTLNVSAVEDQYGEHPFPLGEHPFPFVTHAKILQVIDGDTLQVLIHGKSTPVTLDLDGIDAMEIAVDDMRVSQGEGALRAIDRLRELILDGKSFVFGFEEPSPVLTSLSGESLRAHGFTWSHSERRWLSLNQTLLEEGWAVSHIQFPHTMRASRYHRLTYTAMQEKLGMFSDEFWTGELPFEFRNTIRGVDNALWVGNYRTRKVFEPQSYGRVPTHYRIFFQTLKEARHAGYTLKK